MTAVAGQVQPDMILHLGDLTRDALSLQRALPHTPLVSIAGNCDVGVAGLKQYVDEIDGVRIFACHGHRYGVKSTLHHLYYAALEQDAALCLYGHTHIARCETLRGIQFLNPGACGGMHPTYGVVDIQNGCAHCRTARL